jgi:hypothetical protein
MRSRFGPADEIDRAFQTPSDNPARTIKRRAFTEPPSAIANCTRPLYAFDLDYLIAGGPGRLFRVERDYSGCRAAGLQTHLLACPQGINEIEAGKVFFVVGCNNAPVRFGDGGDNHIQVAPWFSRGATIRH